jgi:hypothetical protein
MEIKGKTAKAVIDETTRFLGARRFKKVCHEITCSIATGATRTPQDAYNAFAFHRVYGLDVFRMITFFWPSL